MRPSVIGYWSRTTRMTSDFCTTHGISGRIGGNYPIVTQGSSLLRKHAASRRRSWPRTSTRSHSKGGYLRIHGAICSRNSVGFVRHASNVDWASAHEGRANRVSLADNAVVARTKGGMVYCRIAAKAAPQTGADVRHAGGGSPREACAVCGQSVYWRGETVVGSAAVGLPIAPRRGGKPVWQ